MSFSVEHFLDLFTEFPQLAGPLFGLLALGESLAIVGAIIPATPILFLYGLMLGSDKLTPGEVIPWAITGAIAGYWISWRAGRRLGPAAYRHPVLRGQRRAVARARLFFRRWGGPSLIIGRFILGPFQSMLPLVAGVAAMSPRRFHPWATASAIIWVLVVLTPGFLTARGITVFGFDASTESFMLTVLLAVSGVLAIGAAAIVVVRLAFGPGKWRTR